MSKWEVIYKEEVTKSVVVEADSILQATKKVLYNPNFDFSDSKVLSKGKRKEYVTANELDD